MAVGIRKWTVKIEKQRFTKCLTNGFTQAGV